MRDRLSGRLLDVRTQLDKYTLSLQTKDAPATVDKLVTIVKKKRQSYGFSIVGGRDMKAGSPCVVSRIEPQSPAALSGQLAEGDAVLKINGRSVAMATHQEIIDLFRNDATGITNRLDLVVRRVVGGRENRRQVPPPADWVDAVVVPLTNASLSRYDSSSEYFYENGFELHSMDRKISCVLYCESTDALASWFSAIQARIRALNRTALTITNRLLSGKDRVIKVGWACERLRSSRHWNAYVPKFLVLRATRVEIFATVPRKTSEWTRPEKSYDLAQLLVFAVREDRLADDRPFCLRIQTPNDDHYFAVETSDDLRQWIVAVDRTTFAMIADEKVRRFPCRWKRRETILRLHIDRGIALVDRVDESIIWEHAFAHLVASSDDKYSIVRLAFRRRRKDADDEERHEIEVPNLEATIYAIKAFLSSKLAAYDPRLARDVTDDDDD